MIKMVDKNKLYQNTKIGELETVSGKWVLNFKIEGIRYVEKAYGKEDGLFLDFDSHRMLGDKKYSYGLAGKVIQNEFFSDMGVNNAEELVGRAVMGIVEKKDKILEGLVAYKIK